MPTRGAPPSSSSRPRSLASTPARVCARGYRATPSRGDYYHFTLTWICIPPRPGSASFLRIVFQTSATVPGARARLSSTKEGVMLQSTARVGLAVALLTAASLAGAQDMEWGIKGGASLADLSDPDDAFGDA